VQDFGKLRQAGRSFRYEVKVRRGGWWRDFLTSHVRLERVKMNRHRNGEVAEWLKAAVC
jgi:hypothetical protein